MDYSPTAKYSLVVTDTNGQAHKSQSRTLTSTEFGEMLRMTRNVGNPDLRCVNVVTREGESNIPGKHVVSYCINRTD